MVELVAEAFPALLALRVVLSVDPEIAGYERVCLEVTGRGSVGEILDQEDSFRAAARRSVAPDQRSLFILDTVIAE